MNKLIKRFFISEVVVIYLLKCDHEEQVIEKEVYCQAY